MIYISRWISWRFIYTHQNSCLCVKDRACSFLQFLCQLLHWDSCLGRFRRLRLLIGDRPPPLTSSLKGESSSNLWLKIHMVHHEGNMYQFGIVFTVWYRNELASFFNRIECSNLWFLQCTSSSWCNWYIYKLSSCNWLEWQWNFSNDKYCLVMSLISLQFQSLKLQSYLCMCLSPLHNTLISVCHDLNTIFEWIQWYFVEKRSQIAHDFYYSQSIMNLWLRIFEFEWLILQWHWEDYTNPSTNLDCNHNFMFHLNKAREGYKNPSTDFHSMFKQVVWVFENYWPHNYI
jgi:hypothetical protein